MYDETNVPGPEVRIRPVVRYLVTTFYHGFQARDGSHGMTGSSHVVCECENERQAEEVAHALQSLHDHPKATLNEQPAQQEDSPQH